MLWLLLFAPLAVVLGEIEGVPAPATFFCAAIAIVPIARPALSNSTSTTPLALLGQAQAAWGEMLRVWTEGANFAALRE